MIEPIQQRIEEQGPLSFADYMAMALYTPEQGYYARGIRQVGRGGDFYTSVSVGSCFGELLARRFLAEWERLGRPERWRITECGAHDGRLALDILDALQASEPASYGALEYAIAEPLENLRAAQANTLAPHGKRLNQVKTANPLKPLPGVVFGNEVLDALPCQVIEWNGSSWQECAVGMHEGKLEWELRPIHDPELQAAVDTLGNDFPRGYRTEVRTGYPNFLAPLHQSLSQGLLLWIDYGFERPDYYQRDRHQGTLRTFEHHQAGNDPLVLPGELDISAHVDFTAVAEVSERLGGKPKPLTSQGNWLTRVAKDWLLAQEGKADAQAVRQFQTLTHPGHLGKAFQVLEVEV
ncbi:MAG: SAM-dependent methyltransferase [Akkermansiaceae bacterium]|nr:SAM-dependent methyltransferase [Akkermansiaceae bacterium]